MASPYTSTPTQWAGWRPPRRRTSPGTVTSPAVAIRPTSRPGWATDAGSAAAGRGSGVATDRSYGRGFGPERPAAGGDEPRVWGFRGSGRREYLTINHC